MAHYLHSQSEEVKEMCKALGFDHKSIARLTLRIDPESVVVVAIEKFVEGDELKRLTGVIENYRIKVEENED